jgi:hypothetical protein
MLGISCTAPAYIQGDNQSVLYNMTLPDSTLKTKSQSIAYHFVRKRAARDEWQTSYVNTRDNDADLLMYVLCFMFCFFFFFFDDQFSDVLLLQNSIEHVEPARGVNYRKCGAVSVGEIQTLNPRPTII